jgi:valyl-tRNA synthetase
MPFVADHVYRELTAGGGGALPSSVHLTRFPDPDAELADPALEEGVAFVRRVVRVGLGARGAAALKVRQPLARVSVLAPAAMLPWLREFEADVLDELNVEAMDVAAADGDLVVTLDTRLTDALERKGFARQLAHQVQLLRKTAGLAVEDRIQLAIATDARGLAAIDEHRDYLCEETLTVDLALGEPPPGFTVQRVRLGRGTTVLGLRRADRPAAPAR